MFFVAIMAPFPQIDVIEEMVIFWRVRGKIVRSVLCSIVQNNYAQCSAHAYEQTYHFCGLGFVSNGPNSLCLDSFLYMYYCMHV